MLAAGEAARVAGGESRDRLATDPAHPRPHRLLVPPGDDRVDEAVAGAAGEVVLAEQRVAVARSVATVAAGNDLGALFAQLFAAPAEPTAPSAPVAD